MATGRIITCETCGDRFKTVKPEEAAAAEFAELFPDESLEEGVVVCDECFHRIMAAWQNAGSPGPNEIDNCR